MASVWPPISGVFSDAPEKAFCQAQRTFLPLPAKFSLFSGSFPTAPGSPERCQSEPTSLCETGLKIRWANTPCGFESHFRHHGPFRRALFLPGGGAQKCRSIGIFRGSCRVPPPVSLIQSSLLSPTFRLFDPVRCTSSFSHFWYF